MRLIDADELESADFSECMDSFEITCIIDAQPTVNAWILCSERLPEDGVDVLVWFEYFRFGEYNRLFQTTGISYTYNGEWSGFVNSSSGWRELNIIAWQPLPQPYNPTEN